MQWPHEGISVRQWQNEMLGYFPKGKSKQAALKVAKKLAPKGTNFKTVQTAQAKANDGVVDAYLIGKFAIENNCK